MKAIKQTIEMWLDELERDQSRLHKYSLLRHFKNVNMPKRFSISSLWKVSAVYFNRPNKA